MRPDWDSLQSGHGRCCAPRCGRPRLFVDVALAGMLAIGSFGIHAQPAPFGLNWGDHLEALPRASSRTKEKNITLLLFKMDRAAGYRDTDEIVLKVCDKEGLQQSIWTGRPLSGEDARRNFASAYAEAVRRYGKPDQGDAASGTASWNSARVTMFAKLVEPGYYRILMIMDGPAFKACTQAGGHRGVPPRSPQQ